MDSSKIELRKAEIGNGVFAKERIGAGELICQWDGPVYSDTDEWTRDMMDHAIWTGDKIWRDSAGLARYLNHSCDPNCGIRGLYDIVAMRDIEENEELKWDYEMTEDCSQDPTSDYYWVLECKCGSPLCRGKISSYQNMPPDARARYRGFISQWLVKKYGAI